MKFFLLSISILLGISGTWSQSIGVKSHSKIYDGVNGLDVENNDLLIGTIIGQLGDVDQDGIEDLGVVGKIVGDDFIYVLFMNSDGTIRDQVTIGRDLGGLSGDVQTNSFEVSAIVGIGDLNDDGVPDVAVGASKQFYILFLKNDGTVDSFKRLRDGRHGVKLDLIEESDFSSSMIGNIDLDGDGNNELIVGDIEFEDENNRGSLHIFYLNDDGTVKKQAQIKKDPKWGYHNTFGLINWHDMFGRSVTTISDINGDGLREIVVSSERDNVDNAQVGAIYCLFVNAEGEVDSVIRRNQFECKVRDSLPVYSGFGWSISNIGDLDGNGFDDLVVGAPDTRMYGRSNGSAVVLYMKEGFEVDTFLKICGWTKGLEFGPKPSSYRFGRGVAGIGDMNNDGMLDIIVGAPEDGEAYDRAGAMYIVHLIGKKYVSTSAIPHPSATSIYPNPSNGVFKIETDGPATLQVLNTCGKVLWQGTTTGSYSLDASQWPAGMYLIRAQQKNGKNDIKRLIVN